MKPITLDTQLSKWQCVCLLMLLIGATIATYYSSLFYGFVFDDCPNIVKLFEIRSRKLSDLFFEHSRWVSAWLNTLYYQVDQLKPFIYRLGNLIIHLINGSLVFAIITMLLGGVRKESFFKRYRHPISFLTAGLFLLHPVQTQTICYVIQGQLEGLAAMSILLAQLLFILYTRAQNCSTRALFALLLLAIGALSTGTKEIAIVSPLLLILTDWFFIAEGSWHSFKKRLWLHALFSITVIVCLCYVLTPAFFWQLIRGKVQPPNNMGNMLTDAHMDSITPYAFFISQFKVIIHYLMIFIWPFGLSADYNWKLSEGFWHADSIGAFLILCALFLWLARIIAQNHTSLVAFAFLWFFIAVLPRASLIPSAELVADYKTYEASVGICLLLAASLVGAALFITRLLVALQYKLYEQQAFWLALCIMLLSGGFLAARRARVWQSAEAFWFDVIARDDDSKARAYNNYAVTLIEKGNHQQAIQHLERAITLDRAYPDPWNNLAIVYGKLGLVDEAIMALQTAISIHPYHAEGYSNLANFFIVQKKYRAAEKALKRAIALRKHYGKALFKLGQVYLFQNDIEQAHLYFKQCCTQADMDTAEGFAAWGKASTDLAKYDEAAEAYERAYKLRPTDDLLYHLAYAYLFNRQLEAAERSFKQLYARYPRDPIIVLGLAEYYFTTQSYPQAMALYHKVEGGKPDLPMLFWRLAACSYKTGALYEAECYLRKFLDARPPDDAAAKARGVLDALEKRDFSAPIWSCLTEFSRKPSAFLD